MEVWMLFVSSDHVGTIMPLQIAVAVFADTTYSHMYVHIYLCILVFVVIVVAVAAALIAGECVQFVVIVLVNIFN